MYVRVGRLDSWKRLPFVKITAETKFEEDHKELLNYEQCGCCIARCHSSTSNQHRQRRLYSVLEKLISRTRTKILQMSQLRV